MFHNFQAISLTSHFFNTPTRLEFFVSPKNPQDPKNLANWQQKNRVSIIFGRNGSGKSSLSRAFSKAANQELENDVTTVELYNYNGSVISPSIYTDNSKTDDNKEIYGIEGVHVFNEKFIDDNIRVKTEDTEGLPSIVMLGQDVQLSKQIDDLEEELKEKLESLRNIESDINEAEAECKEAFEACKKSLKNWANHERELKQLHRNPSIDKAKISELAEPQTIPSQSLEELNTVYAETDTQIKNLKKAQPQIHTEIPYITQKIEDDRIIEMLNMDYQELKLNPEENEAYSVMTNDELFSLTNTLKVLQGDRSICPLCLQKIENSFKKLKLSHLNTINTLTKNSIDAYKQELISLLNQTQPIEIPLSAEQWKCLYDETKSVDEAMKVFNAAAAKCQLVIKKKIDNPYAHINIASFELDAKLLLLREKVNSLRKAQEQFNKDHAPQDLSPLKNQLIQYNRERAYYEVHPTYQIYLNADNKLTLLDEEKTQTSSDINNLRQKITDLKQQMKNTSQAAVLMNNFFNYIFFDKERLYLKPDSFIDPDTHEERLIYRLYSRGSSLPPSSSSTGERNILALCYFFARLHNHMQGLSYSKPLLLVLDDPVSSFDQENRIGIITFLKYVISEVLNGNPGSKIIFMTHDIVAANNLYKITDDYYAENGISLIVNDKRQLCHELSSKKFNDLKYDFNEYRSLIGSMYEYACLDLTQRIDSNLDSCIGNYTRRVIEAFSTFEFRRGIDFVLYVDKIKKQLNSEYGPFFQSLANKLLLHGESHSEDRVKFLNVDFAPLTDPLTKQKIVRAMLCLMHIVNPLHIEECFRELRKKNVPKNTPDIKTEHDLLLHNLQQWKEDLKSEHSLTQTASQ